MYLTVAHDFTVSKYAKGGADLRPKINNQSEFSFQPATLQITDAYYAKYEAISAILDEHPQMVNAIHRDLAEALKDAAVRDRRGAKFKFTSDTILRMVICQIVEGLYLPAQVSEYVIISSLMVTSLGKRVFGFTAANCRPFANHSVFTRS